MRPLTITSSIVIDYSSREDEEDSRYMMLSLNNKSLSNRFYESEKKMKKQGLSVCFKKIKFESNNEIFKSHTNLITLIEFDYIIIARLNNKYLSCLSLILILHYLNESSFKLLT